MSYKPYNVNLKFCNADCKCSNCINQIRMLKIYHLIIQNLNLLISDMKIIKNTKIYIIEDIDKKIKFIKDNHQITKMRLTSLNIIYSLNKFKEQKVKRLNKYLNEISHKIIDLKNLLQFFEKHISSENTKSDKIIYSNYNVNTVFDLNKIFHSFKYNPFNWNSNDIEIIKEIDFNIIHYNKDKYSKLNHKICELYIEKLNNIKYYDVKKSIEENIKLYNDYQKFKKLIEFHKIMENENPENEFDIFCKFISS